MGGSDDLMGTIGSAIGMGITIGVAKKAINMIPGSRRSSNRRRRIVRRKRRNKR